jgi:ribonuclease P protein component
LTVTFAPTTSPGPPQVAYSVSRRVGTAVGRNRVRRQLRAVMRTMPLVSGAYLVTVAPPASGQSSAQLRHWLTSALARLERTGD